MAKKKSNNVALVRGLIIGGVALLGAGRDRLRPPLHHRRHPGRVRGRRALRGDRDCRAPPSGRQRGGRRVLLLRLRALQELRSADPRVAANQAGQTWTSPGYRSPSHRSGCCWRRPTTPWKHSDILEQNHDRIFRRIHNTRRMFASPEEVAEFIDGNGATADGIHGCLERPGGSPHAPRG